METTPPDTTEAIPEAIPEGTEREMTLQEMLFLVSSFFYIDAIELGQKALIEKDQTFIVILNADNPEIKLAKAAAEAEVSGRDADGFGGETGTEIDPEAAPGLTEPEETTETP